jgi:hypothetical protein
MVMNKKGIIKIIEASVAILIVASILFISYNKSVVGRTTDYSENARDILEELANNVSLRNVVLGNGNVDSFIDSKLPTHLNYEARICEVNAACGISSLPSGDVYSGERIISSNLSIYDPKKVRLFLWEKE